jgi:RNA polymerase sigma-70 factor, ECF subfamily
MDLLRAARKGSPDALLQLFDEQHVPLFHIAFRLTGSLAETEEILQECFLALLAPDCRYDPRREPLHAYLFGEVRNRAAARADSRAASVDGLPLPRSHEMPMQTAVMYLPETEREVLILAHYLQLPLAEIGRLLGVDMGTVKSRLQHARTFLKDTRAAYAMSDSDLDRRLDGWTAPAVPPSIRSRLAATLPAPRRRKRVRGTLAAAVGVAAIALGISMLQNGVLSSEAGRWDDHTYVRRTRIVQPPIGKLRWMFLGRRSTGWQWWKGRLVGSEYLFGGLNHIHYGYSWSAQPVATGEYLFSVLPLDPSAIQESGPVVEPGPVPSPAIVSGGSAFEVNLYASGTERVYDRIELSAHPMSTGGNPDPPHETVNLTLRDPKLYVNGRFAAEASGENQGLTSVIDVPRRGRFVMALYQGGNHAFIEAGSVKGNTLEFEWAGETFRVECTAPISPNGDRPLFVMLQTRANVSAYRFSSGGAPNQYR